MSGLHHAEVAKQLRTVLRPDQVLYGPAAERVYDSDAYTVDRSSPNAVVLPESTEDVAKVVKWCNTHNVPFTPRGAGTGLSGGATAVQAGVIISTKKLTHILEIDIPNRRMLAEAGVVNKNLSDAVREHGLHFAPDPSSQTVATLGGNIAENAGGPHTLKYGVTVQHITGLTVVTPEGEIMKLGGKVAGGPGLDLLGVLIGGEGTLGVVTEAWVKLTPLASVVKTALISFKEVRDATQTVADIIATGTIPAALEMMDRGILTAVGIAFGIQFHPEAAAVLLVECDAPAGGEAQVEREMSLVGKVSENNHALEIRIAKDEAERANLWKARKSGVAAMGRLAPSVVTHDGVIPRSKLPEMLDRVYEIASRHGVGVANLFHAGDGNLHPCFYFDDRDPKQVDAVVEAGQEIIQACLDLGGSATGEHGIGVEKVGMMAKMFTPDDLAFQTLAKRLFNEGELCNPCKVLPDQKSCVEHRHRSKGVAW